MKVSSDTVIVIGAGIGGLAAALRLAVAGMDVTLLEAHGAVGGKMRLVPSAAGPVDAGPTVLTLRPVFEALFAAAGTRLEDMLTLLPLPVLARHWWPDGTRLDLVADPRINAEAICATFGARAAQEFARFDTQTRALMAAFDAPIIRAPAPDLVGAARAAITAPRLWPWLAPGRSLQSALTAQFSDPHLRQLFGRYATYVGGVPQHSPALLALIWQAEAAGVWAVKGGMARLAQVLADLFVARGGRLRLNAAVGAITQSGGQVRGVRLSDGAEIHASHVVFNGDPAALVQLLDTPELAPPARATQPRSLSARVWTFAANVAPGHPVAPDDLRYHNVFFAQDSDAEFGPLASGKTPSAPTIYACAQDRATGPAAGPERFQLILNAPPLSRTSAANRSEEPSCQINPFERLEQFGLHLTPRAEARSALTTPQDFARLFPHSMGAIYGRSPQGMLASFLRPRARAGLNGLYLAGGGVHPGPGVPMAALSGQHAAEAVLADRISALRLPRTAMPGGISTGSARTERALFR